VYNTITDKAARGLFLENFESQGAGRGPNSLKWVCSFSKSLEQKSQTIVASVEDLLTRPQVLQHLGLRLSDFDDEAKALAMADAAIARNREEFEHDGAEEIVPHFPLLSRYRYVISQGKKREWSQIESKKMDGITSLKNVEHLRQGKQFLECMGPELASASASGADGSGGAPQTNEKQDELAAIVLEYRREVRDLQAYHDPLRELLAKLKAKAAKDSSYQVFEVDLARIVGELKLFVDGSMDSIFTYEAMDKSSAEEEDLQKASTNFKKQTTLCKHHLLGAKAAKTRFSGILNVDEPPMRKC